MNVRAEQKRRSQRVFFFAPPSYADAPIFDFDQTFYSMLAKLAFEPPQRNNLLVAILHLACIS